MATLTTTAPTNRMSTLNPTPSNAATSASKPSERVRIYKDFLTPALHRRFTRSAVLILAACYLESTLISPPSLFWIWNPIGLTGARAILLFGPCLAIFIVRVANIHVGQTTTPSSAQTVYDALKSFRTWHTLAWYLWSAWFFGELYIWSQSAKAHLTWVDPGQEYERPKLNENPMFLRSFLFCLGIAQTYLHLARGYDRVPLSPKEPAPPAKEKTGQQQDGASQLPETVQALVARLPSIGACVLRLVVPGLVLTIPIYFSLIRYVVWPYYYFVGRLYTRDLLPAEQPTGVGVDYVFTLVWQSVFSASLLAFLWELSNAIFTIYISQPPVRLGQPITSEIKDAQGTVVSQSKDPNSSLLSGLKSKKELLRSFACWELWLICSDFDVRRKTIYTEVDRKDGSTWLQISKTCLDEIESIKERIKASQKPVETKQSLEAKEKERLSAQTSQDLTVIPKIADRGVVDGNVWQKGRSDLASRVSNAAKDVGQSPRAGKPLLSPLARNALARGRDRLLSKEDQERISYQTLRKDVNGLLIRALQSPLGEPFRQTFARRVRRVILGGPTSRKTTIIFAAKSLARLAVCSLKEDDYGQVAKSIPVLMRAFTSTINEIDAFTATLPPHWTDVYFSPRDREHVGDVREVQEALQNGLQDILLAFGEYAAAVGITKLDLREAREAVGKTVEMRKV